ncbi:PR5-like receptor kinase, partial [Hibiscus syriacus]|uniref:PR5-like receptor kinase n=1 Tax=Hibiscus syriacus TaxID=106335 RepID=UPI0019249E00
IALFPRTSSIAGTKFNRSLPFSSGLGIAGAAIVGILLVVGIICFRKKWQKINDNAEIEAFINKFVSLTPRRYFYGEIKKMTNKFKDKLGQGGYGTVYKGTLPDGRLVAVKVLGESKGNGEDFMNEVASICRTSHVNIVTLLGFCFERSKRALVYEFMTHGSLDRFIYDRVLHHQRRQLEWKTLYDIAVGIARGLEYLHQGCNTRILHFDIKPHNVLLDDDFCPKISDFGLSKLCERKESVISMACARGTIGYIAPEMVCRNFGGVSYKSDVYSYGMMVLEMVGGRKNIDVGVSQTSEIYFPSWIYSHLDRSMNLDPNGVTDEEEEIKRKLIIASLWCIQLYPSDRPSMSKVLEMLQGELQSLMIPPRPVESSSPVRSPITYIETRDSKNDRVTV